MRNLIVACCVGLFFVQPQSTLAERASLDNNAERTPDLSVPENTYGIYRDQYGAYRDSSMLPDNTQVPIIEQRRYSYKHNVAPKPNVEYASGMSSPATGMAGGMQMGAMGSGGMGGGMPMGGGGGGIHGGGPPVGTNSSNDGRFSETGVVFGLFDTKGIPQSVAIVGPNNSTTTLTNSFMPPPATPSRVGTPDSAYHSMEREVFPEHAHRHRFESESNDFPGEDYIRPMRGHYGEYMMPPMPSSRTVSARTFNPLARLLGLQAPAAAAPPARRPHRSRPRATTTATTTNYRPILSVSATRIPQFSLRGPRTRPDPAWISTPPSTKADPPWLQM